MKASQFVTGRLHAIKRRLSRIVIFCLNILCQIIIYVILKLFFKKIVFKKESVKRRTPKDSFAGAKENWSKGGPKKQRRSPKYMPKKGIYCLMSSILCVFMCKMLYIYIYLYYYKLKEHSEGKSIEVFLFMFLLLFTTFNTSPSSTAIPFLCLL